MAKRQFSTYSDCFEYATTHNSTHATATTSKWRIRPNRYLHYNLDTMEYSLGSAHVENVRILPDDSIVYLTTNPNGCILYDGPSRIDGQRIIVILTGLTDDSANSKTGKMLQTWILRADRKPTTARKEGCDVSVCGDCPHRRGSCYVNLGQGPRAVYDCWSAGKGYSDYDPSVHDPLISDRTIRLGSYGDPSAVPIETFEPILAVADSHTGYTHQWDKPIGSDYRAVCMASVDTVEQADDAVRAGWRYFYACPSDYVKRKWEVNCPASVEAGQKTQCNDCTLCFGRGEGKGRLAPSIFIVVHGNRAQKSIYYNLIRPALADTFSHLV
jgi:hypothetical protein